MNKVFGFLLAACLFVNLCAFTAFADALSEQSDGELLETLRAIRSELALRGYRAEAGRSIFAENGIEIFINGELYVEETWLGPCLVLPLVIVNECEQDICVQILDPSVNGWACDAVFSPSVPAHKKMKEEIRFDLEGTDVEALAAFEDAEFCFTVFDDDTWTDIAESEIVTLVA